jgi:hypothetical protein
MLEVTTRLVVDDERPLVGRGVDNRIGIAVDHTGVLDGVDEIPEGRPVDLVEQRRPLLACQSVGVGAH